jgi:predicted SprT family Zn-dependent metalloprotease
MSSYLKSQESVELQSLKDSGESVQKRLGSNINIIYQFTNRLFRTIAYVCVDKNSIIIRMSYLCWRLISDSLRIEIMSHEICHAVDYHNSGNLNHGRSWKKLFSSLGYIPKTEYELNLPSKVLVFCDCCVDSVSLDLVFKACKKCKSPLRLDP